MRGLQPPRRGSCEPGRSDAGRKLARVGDRALGTREQSSGEESRHRHSRRRQNVPFHERTKTSRIGIKSEL